MITFPNFIAATENEDLLDLAIRSGVPIHMIESYRDGCENPPSYGIQWRLAHALGDANPIVLFRPHAALEACLADAEAQGYQRAIDDPAVLRLIDRSA